MNVSEFTALLKPNFSPFTMKDFDVINYVYMFHPAIPDVGGKGVIAALYNVGGMPLILSMIPLAREGEERDKRLRALRAQRDSINRQI